MSILKDILERVANRAVSGETGLEILDEKFAQEFSDLYAKVKKFSNGGIDQFILEVHYRDYSAELAHGSLVDAILNADKFFGDGFNYPYFETSKEILGRLDNSLAVRNEECVEGRHMEPARSCGSDTLKVEILSTVFDYAQKIYTLIEQNLHVESADAEGTPPKVTIKMPAATRASLKQLCDQKYQGSSARAQKPTGPIGGGGQ